MFSLAYIDAEGRTLGPVETASGRAVNTQHASTARRLARAEADAVGASILISRVINGAPRPSTVIHPDGSSGRPPGFRPVNAREDCKRGSGARCFCSACRAERRASA